MAAATTAPAGSVRIVSDTVYPWCFVGKRNLERALALLPQSVTVESVRWMPYQLGAAGGAATQHRGPRAVNRLLAAFPLLPHAFSRFALYGLTPAHSAARHVVRLGHARVRDQQGVSKVAYYDARFGKGVWRLVFGPRLAAAFASAGIEEPFTLDGLTGPTGDSHWLLAWAAATRGEGAQSALAEQLFRAHFLRGRPLSDPAVLVAAAESAGLDGEAARRVLDSGDFGDAVEEGLGYGRARAVAGVPHFVIRCGEGAGAVEAELGGAQAPEEIARATEGVARRARGGAA